MSESGASFYIYETTELVLTVEDDQGNPDPTALADISEVVVSIYQPGAEQLNLTSADLAINPETAQITASLTQEQTANFHQGLASVQLNIKYANTERDASTVGTVKVLDNLYRRVME